MFRHITLGTNDRAASERFHDAVMETLGLARVERAEEYTSYAKPGGGWPRINIGAPFDGRPARPGNGFHLALHAPDEAAVRRFHEAALRHGGTDECAPGIRAAYAPDYYGAYVRDPDGNKLQAVTYPDGRVVGPGGDTISHVTLGIADLERARLFYEAAMRPLGLVRIEAEETPGEDLAIGLASTQLPLLFPQFTFDGKPPAPANGAHLALFAPDRAAVDAAHAAALANGGTDEGAPGLRPHYAPDYYAAYFRDPDGNKLQAVCDTPGG
jgi:catechol 2,3-dioxygenase-like lactoylglutathione lyase family enzyme